MARTQPFIEDAYPNQVRELRLAHDPPWSISELARAAGLHKAQVSCIERGFWVPRDHTQQKLANALGVTRDEAFPQVAE